MGKLAIFSLLWWITGSPFIALLVLLIIIYAIDRRYVGLLPDITKPFKESRRLAALHTSVRLNPHNNSDKLEIARILIRKRRYGAAKSLLEQITEVLSDSAEAWFGLGLCKLKTGNLAQGEADMLKALSLNPRVAYGEPYLRLGEAFAGNDPQKALMYLEKFGEVQSSSCEAYVLLGDLYARLGRSAEAKRSYREAREIYRQLPKYRRKAERKWAVIARLKA